MNHERTDAETNVIASLIHEPRRLLEVRHLDKSYFEDTACRLVYVAALKYHERAALKGRVRYAPQEAIERELDRMLARTKDAAKNKARKRARASVNNLIDEIAQTDPLTDEQFTDAVDRVVEQWLDGQTRTGLLELADTLSKGAEGVHSKLQALAARLTPAVRGMQIERLDLNAKQSVIDHVRAKSNKQGAKIPTFCPTLNRVTSGGGKRGRMWIVTAYAKGGKSITGLNLLYHVAKCGLNVAIVTNEQTTSDIRTMLVCRHSHLFINGGLEYNRVEEGKLDAKQEAILRRVVEDLQTNTAMGRVHYFKTPHGTTIGEVRGMLESIHQRTPLAAVMIDHTGLFAPTRKQDSQTANAAAVMMELKDLALNFGADGLWVIACHQISREGYENAIKRGGYYIPKDMANTVEAERSCDLMLYAYRDEDLIDASEIRLGVAIDRHGPGEIKGWSLMESFATSAIFPIKDVP